MQDLMVGDEASMLRHMLELSYPMENGIVRNWEEMQHIWDYTFGKAKLNLDPTECKVLLTEPPMNPNKNREKLIEVSWQTLLFSSRALTSQLILLRSKRSCLRSTASTDAMWPFRRCSLSMHRDLWPVSWWTQATVWRTFVQSTKAFLCHTSPSDWTLLVVTLQDIWSRYERLHNGALFGWHFWSTHLCRFTLKLLLLRGYAFNHSADFETVRIMKEQLCYVAHDIEEEQKLALETTVLVESYTVEIYKNCFSFFFVKLFHSSYIKTNKICSASWRTSDQDWRRAIRSARDLVPAPSSQLWGSWHCGASIQHHPAGRHRHEVGLLQAYRAQRWHDHVSGLF